MALYLKFDVADLKRPDVDNLLNLHLAEAQINPATAALGKDALAHKNTTLYSARDKTGLLVGIAALKTLNESEGELKSVRTHPDFLRRGVSTQLMNFIEQMAKSKGMSRLSLETHPTPQYAAACALYERLGYTYCAPFADYKASPNCVFMMKRFRA